VTDEVRPFRIDVGDDALDDLRDRLGRIRWPDQIPGSGWEYGTDLAALQDLCTYWRDEFDWRAAEARMNAWPQFETDVDGTHLHLIHARSPHPDALPLVMTHGWPGSVAEFLNVLGPLTDPPAHGGDAADAFHVVAPSMPGYGFSGPTTRSGIDVRAVAEVIAGLMARLGYARYGAQGGDWGAMVSTHLGLADADHVAGIHLNMVVARPPKTEDPMAGVQPDEMAALGDIAEFLKDETGYQAIQGTKPQTLAYGLTDSPAGLAGWILEKFRTWSDCRGDVFTRFTRDELLTNIAIYWFTGTINASTRLYCESRRSGRFDAVSEQVPVPMGAAIFPKELFRPPRAWAEAVYDVVHWTRMPSGGHFAAMEEPELLVDDVRSFFRPLR
jgi:pimeloyl-ACP methyl ester carboxylesterase